MTNKNTDTKPPIIDFKLLVLVVLISIPIPIVSWLTSLGIQSRIESTYESALVEAVQKEKGVDIRQHPDVMAEMKLSVRCWDYNETSAYVKQLCSTKSDVASLETLSIVTLVLSVLVIFGSLGSGLGGRFNRFLLLGVFRIGLWLTQISVALLVVANAALAIMTIYWAESWFIGRVHVGLIGVLGLVCGLAALRIAIGSFKFSRKVQARVFGKRLGRVDYPGTWNFIETIAKEAGTRPPDHIVVGLDPTFFVTEAPVICIDGTLNGRTLFLSLPFCRVLHRKELASIVGHEFGHFVGMDTTFSRWFFPIYRGATDTVQTLTSNMGSESNALQSLTFMPPLFVMSFFLSSFARIENEISRERELAADKLGALIAGSDSMISSLIKVHAYAKIWDYTQDQMKEALQEGKVLTNASAHFAAVAGVLPDDVFKKDLDKAHPIHPTDTHPSLSRRLQSLGADLNIVLSKPLKKVEDNDRAVILIENFETLESELSELEHYKMVKTGVVSVGTSEPDKTDDKKETA